MNELELGQQSRAPLAQIKNPLAEIGHVQIGQADLVHSTYI